jgi:hypothetical protein
VDQRDRDGRAHRRAPQDAQRARAELLVDAALRTSAKPKANHLAVIKAALGVASLSRDAPVEAEVIVQVRDK